MRAHGWLRAGLIFLGVVQGFAAVVQLLAPKVFYDDFPAPGHSWVAMFPPYNEHLMRDFGSASLAVVFVLAVAAITMQPLLVRTALAANLVFAVPHFLYHAMHLQHFSVGAAIGQTIALAVPIVVPIALLMLPVSPRAAVASTP
jgi:hypothetical protein